jgi:predicted alpha/beta superfamily hydrolase
MPHSRPPTSIVLAACLAAAVANTGTQAKAAPIVAPALETHRIESKFVDQTFEIYVQVPMHRTDGSERFPVLYQTDSYGGMAFGDITRLMQLGGDVPRFITVGIGYVMEHASSASEIRARDLTQVEGPSGSPGLSAFIEGAPQLKLEKQSGGAAQFLQFIRQELQPFIDENYPTIPEEKGYWGDSLGGLFGLYVLFNQPDTFNRYIIGSPSIWWADRAIMMDAKAFLKSTKALDARVFMAVGALEERGGDGADSAMVTNLFQLETLLRNAKIEGLELTTHLFPNETHTTVVAMNFIRGLQSVYTRPEVPFLVEVLTPPEPKE